MAMAVSGAGSSAREDQPIPSLRETTYVLRAAEGDTSDAGDVLQAELGNGLASLLLVTGVNGDRSAAGDGGLLAGLGLVRAASVLDVGLGDLLIRELFNTGVGHCECM